MRRKTFLALIEQIVMLLVFTAAALLCLRAFVWAAETAEEAETRDRAMIQAQSAAEVLKACAGNMEEAAAIFGGVWDGSIWKIHFDPQWEQSSGDSFYLLEVVSGENTLDYLGSASVCIYRKENCLVRLDIAWQEEQIG